MSSVSGPFHDVVWISPLGHTYTVPAPAITTPQQLTTLEHHLLETIRQLT